MVLIGCVASLAVVGAGLVEAPSTASARHHVAPLSAPPLETDPVTALVPNRVARAHQAAASAATDLLTRNAARAEARAVGRPAVRRPVVDGAPVGYGATPLAPASTWSAGGSSGSFDWTYPLKVPVTSAGPSPSLSLDYDSQSSDGRTPSTNNQGSLIGEGFDLTGSYISRSYGTCDDLGGTGYDKCWRGDFDSLVLNGQSSQLVQIDGHPNSFRLSNDDGSIVKRMTGADNGTTNGEYWELTTSDGTQYWFGRDHLPGSSESLDTDSTWTVPVSGVGAGDPCDGTSGDPHWCQLGWRWNLDEVVDAHGSASTYWYTKEQNHYLRGGSANHLVAYDAGGYLSEIDYGLRADNLFDGSGASKVKHPAPQRVTFATVGRCVKDPAGTGVCAVLNHKTKSYWPDVPFSSMCGAGDTCANNDAPTFYTTQMLAGVTTQVIDAAGHYQNVDAWTLTHKFLNPNEQASNSDDVLWLRTIQHTGDDPDGDQVVLPKVVLSGDFRDNRVDSGTDDIPALSRPRLTTILTETGEVITINYPEASDIACDTGVAPAHNTQECYPVIWNPNGGPRQTDWFFKYVVSGVTVEDPNATSATITTTYVYAGAAWHFSDSPMTERKYATWSDWRGFSKVTALKGVPTETRSKTVSYYMQGMNGDNDGHGGQKRVQSSGVLADPIDDDDQYQGFAREQVVYNGYSPKSRGGFTTGPMVTDTVYDPWSTQTASHTFAPEGRFDGYTINADIVRSKTTSVTTNILDGTSGSRTQTTNTTFNGDGLPTKISDLGDTAVRGDESCTLNTYVTSSDRTLRNLLVRTQVLAVPCNKTRRARFPHDDGSSGDVISDVATLYDGNTQWDDQANSLTAGDITETDRVTGYGADGNPSGWQQVTASQYDPLGRVTAMFDADNAETDVAYTPSGPGVMTKTVVKNALGQKTTTTFEPAWGVPLTITDPNGNETWFAYDGLGRTVKVWRPNVPGGPGHPASISYGYHVSQSDANWTSTTTPAYDQSGTTLTSYAFYDALTRPVETQEPNPNGGSLISATVYDDRGNATQQFANVATSTPPAPTEVNVLPGHEPEEHDITYDGADRPTQHQLRNAHSVLWTTATDYEGDSVGQTAPDGGSATRVFTDVLGRTTEKRVYGSDQASGSNYRSTSYAYYDTGDLESVTGPSNAQGDPAVWTYQYDLYGRIISASDPDSGTTTNTYTNLDQLLSTTDARGRTLSYGYDALGRKTDEWHGTNQTNANLMAHWDYDTATNGIGKLADSVRYTAGKGSDAYQTSIADYDTLGQPLHTTVTLPGDDPLVSAHGVPASGITVTDQYNGQTGALGAVQTPALDSLMPAQTTIIGYDAVGLPTTLSGWVAATGYTDQGQVDQMILSGSNPQDPNQVDVQKTYNDGTWTLASFSAEDLIHGYYSQQATYSYDQNSDLMEVADSATLDGASQPEYQCFAYDNYGELHQAWTPGDANGGADDCDPAGRTQSNIGGAAPYWTTYDYNSDGQRSNTVRHASSGNTTTAYTYGQSCTGATAESVHALTSTTVNGSPGASYSCDADGDMTSRPGRQAPTETLGWDKEGHLSSISEAAAGSNPAWTTNNIYDADGNLLVRRTQTTDSSGNPIDTQSVLYDGDLEVHLDQNTTTGKTITIDREFELDGTPVGVESATSGQSGLSHAFLVTDPHNTANLSFDRDNGFAITKRWFGPFGALLGAPPSWPDDRRFLDKTFDPLDRLTQIGDRFYDAGTGAFLSLDPVLNTADPLSLNGYAYADENPLTNSDPSGDMLNGSQPSGDSYDAEHGYFPQPAHIGITGSSQDTTDLNTGRWVLPKGPTPAEIAGAEAYVRYQYKLYKQQEEQAAACRPWYERGWDDITHVFSSLTSWMSAHKAMIAGVIASRLTFTGCEALTEGAGSVACAEGAEDAFDAVDGALATTDIATDEASAALTDEAGSEAANAATRADIAGARFAQKSYSEMFSSGGRFAGQSIDDVAGSLRSGALSPKDVPIDVIVRDGNSLILNTRSSQALIRAGVPRSSWNVIDRTGQAAYESRLTGQLSRNGLSSYGTELP